VQSPRELMLAIAQQRQPEREQLRREERQPVGWLRPATEWVLRVLP
jgi:hypothetical protein